MPVLNFIEDEILGMRFLNSFIGNLLLKLGFSEKSKLFGSFRFFIYDTLKITILLLILIFIVSYIQSYFPPEKTKRIIGNFKGIKANIASALLGTVTPFCSCSSIPLFMGFLSAGLPLGVTFSFLISSPMVDLGSLILLSGIWGWKIALIYVIFGVIVSVLGGVLIEKLNLINEVEDFILNAPAINLKESKKDFKERIAFSKYQAVSTFKKVFPYILIGVGIGSLIHNFIPKEYIIKLLGSSNPFGVIIAVLAGIPMYADIFGTIPVAEALLAKGALLGVVLSFMMAVTTLSLPSLILLRKAVKPKLLAVFVTICTLGIILAGYIFNLLHPFLI